MKTLFNPSRWPLAIVIKDLINYNKFKNIIKSEARNPNSKLNQFKIKYNRFYTLYLIVSLDESDKGLDEKMKRFRVFEILKPVHQYLDDELGFAGSLTPEFSQFVDDKGIETLSYAAIYRFVFEKFSILWLIKWIFILSTLITLIIKYNIITWIITHLT